MEKLRFKFNPLKELNLNESVRLVIQDWKAEQFHTVQVLEPKEQITLDEDDFDQHLYYRFKYQVKRDEKWEDFTRYKNLPERETEDGIKYLYYHYPNSPGLIVIFQALASTPGYNYVRTLKDVPVSKLYIKDEYGPDPTNASYYLGKNKSFTIAESTSKLIESIRQHNKVSKESVICAGSSKGGFASIYQAYLNGYGYAVAGGPQIYLGNYLGKSLGNPKSVLAPIYTFITGSSTDNEIQWANSILPELIKEKKDAPCPQLDIHVGKDEPHYKNHVLPFYNFLQEIGGQKVKLDLGDYDNHDELATYFPLFLSEKINHIVHEISTNFKKTPFLFRRTEPNSLTIETAEMIMNNEIFLFKTWKPYKFEGELNWDEDPYDDKTWKFYLHELRVVSFLINAYEITGKSKYLKKAKWFIESWLRKNSTPENSVNEWAWSGHGTANRLLNLIYFWSFYKKSTLIDLNFDKNLTKLLLQHGEFLANDEHYEDYNHGIFQDQALLELAVVFPDFEQSKEWLYKSLKRLTARIKKDFTSSGVHKEHSPSYHLLVMKLFLSIKNFMDHYNVSYSEEFKNLFPPMQDYLSVLINEDGTLPLLGDTGLSKALNSLKEEEVASDYWLYKYSRGAKGKPLDKDFYIYPDGGVAIYKGSKEMQGNKVEWIFTSAFHSTVHKHADDLSFLLKVDKTNYIVDSGRYNYKEKDPFRRYFRSVFAHNVIAVDGKTYPITRDQVNKSCILDYGHNDSFTYVAGKHELYEGITIKRLLLQVHNGPLLIHDKVFSSEKHTYTQIFNLGKDVTVNKENNQSIVLNSRIDKSHVEIKQIIPVEETQMYEGSSDPIRGWQSFDFNQKHPIKTLHSTTSGSSVEFLTLFNVSGSKRVEAVKAHNEQSHITYEFLNNNNDSYNISIENKITKTEAKARSMKNRPMIKDIALSIDDEVVQQGTVLTATIEDQGENATYAWYVYHNGERVEVKRYSPELKNITITLDKEGIYYLKAYAKGDNDIKSSKNSRQITVKKTKAQKKKSLLDLYPITKIEGEDLQSLEMDFQNPKILTVNKNNTLYDFLIRIKPDSPFLYVIGSGAYNSKEYSPPNFQRHSWLERIDGNVIYYNDPTLYLGEINLGWGQGTVENYYLENVAEIIRILAGKMMIDNKNILFYGSSAGGFMSLMLGGMIKGSSVLVNNPQTIVSNYFRSHVEGMYEVSYSGLSFEEIKSTFKNRLDVTAFYASLDTIPNIYYLQNSACQHDMENHFTPFFKKHSQYLKEGKVGELITHLYFDEKENHNPVSEQETLEFLSKATNMFLRGK
ncbi:heparinase II/III family protein [Cytobacillus firmus]|uniref:heparinase II/III family protein n=1 Tax=Cytobacillus firmus TaxID=1399 RepID=UPI001CFD6D06|nr:heparinase II/III family protein [Cytobacillus firmus]